MFDVAGVGANSVDYVYCLPEFPRPDTPSAKLRIGRHLISCGGQTATTLTTCAAMGLRTAYIGTTGNDSNGRRMRDELSRRGIDVANVRVRDVINPFAVILLDEREGERVVLWDRDATLQLQQAEIDPATIGQARLLHVDDADEEAAIHTARLGREAGIPVTSDIERVTARTEELVAAVTIPIFAEHALEPLTGERDVERALRKVAKTAGPTAGPQRRPSGPAPRTMAGRRPSGPAPRTMVCVTLGRRGAMLLDGDRLYHEPAFQVEVKDTTGAGDVFRGAFITALLRGDAPADVLRFANAAAAISCTRIGAIASVPTLEESRLFLQQQKSERRDDY